MTNNVRLAKHLYKNLEKLSISKHIKLLLEESSSYESFHSALAFGALKFPSTLKNLFSF